MVQFCGNFALNWTVQVVNGTTTDGQFPSVLQRECFINGLRMFPHVVFILVAVPVWISLNHTLTRQYHARSWVHFPHHALRWTITGCLLLLNILQILEGALSSTLQEDSGLHLYLPYAINLLGTVVAIAYYHSIELWNSPRFLLALFPYWLAACVIDSLRVLCLHGRHLDDAFFRVHLARAGVCINFFLLIVEIDVLRQLRYAFCRKKRKVLQPPEDLVNTRYVHDYVSLFSKVTFIWLRPVIAAARRRSLESKDMGQLPENDSAQRNYELLRDTLERETARGTDRGALGPAVLWRSYWRAFWPAMALAGICRLLGDLLHFVAPLCLYLVISYIEGHGDGDIGPISNVTSQHDHPAVIRTDDFFHNGYVVMVMLGVCLAVVSTLGQTHHFLAQRQGVRLRAAIQMLVYNKALTLGPGGSDNDSVLSHLTSHVTLDANNLLLYFYSFHSVWAMPLKAVVALVCLYHVLGAGGVVAGGLLLVLCPLQHLLARRYFNTQKTILGENEERLQACGDLLRDMVSVRLHGWQALYTRRVEAARRRQQAGLLRAACVKAVIVFLAEASPVIAALVAVLLHSGVWGGSLRPSAVFPCLLLLDFLVQPIVLLPSLLSYLADARLTNQRIIGLLNLSDVTARCDVTGRSRHASGSTDIIVTFDCDSEEATSQLLEADRRDPRSDPGPLVAPRQPRLLGATGDLEMAELSPGLGTISEESGESNENLRSQPTMESLVSSSAAPPDGSDVTTQPANDKGVNDEERAVGCHTNDVTSISQDACTTDDVTSGERSTTGSGDEKKLVPRDPKDVRRDLDLSCPPSPERKSLYKSRLSAGALSVGLSASALSVGLSAGALSVGGSGLDDSDIDHRSGEGIAVRISSGSFSWRPESGHMVLNDVDFRADAGQLTVVVGPPGAGKTSILLAILGELASVTGSVSWKSGMTVAYVRQRPWLCSVSARDNILFGTPFEQRRYKRVLRACLLPADLDRSNDFALSDAVRQRVALARALYSRADLVLMDAPLALQDFHTAAHVFEDAVLKFLLRRRRSVVMVTDRTPFLPFAYQIYRLEDGCITHRGNLQEIKVKDAELFATWQRAFKDITRETTLTLRETQKGAKDCGTPEKRAAYRGIWDIQRQSSQTGSLTSDDDSGSDAYGSSDGTFLPHRFSHVSFLSDLSEGGQALGGERGSAPWGSRELVYSTQSSREAEEDLLPAEETETKSVTMPLPREGAEDGPLRGVVPPSTLWTYALACGPGLAAALALCQGVRVAFWTAADVWLARWTAQTSVSVEGTQTETYSAGYGGVYGGTYSGVYSVLAGMAVLLSLVVAAGWELTGVRAAQRLHAALLAGVLHTPLRLFTKTVSGDWMNRLSADMSAVDEKLVTTLEHMTRSVLLCGGVLLVNAMATPYFLLAGVPLLVVMVVLVRVYWPTARQLYHLDHVTKYPLLAHVTDTLSGLTSIRAFRDTDRFLSTMATHVDISNRAYLWLHTANRWFLIRLEYLAVIVVLFSGMLTVYFGCHGYVSSSMAGLALLYALLLSGHLQWTVRGLGETVIHTNALDRVCRYIHQSQPQTHDTVIHIPESWPTLGEIAFKDVTLTYDPTADPVIRNASFYIGPGAKVVVRGGPGSGKTALALGLFGLLETTEGQIYVDGTDISKVPMATLRSRLAMLTQEPVVITASVRENLDPDGDHPDSVLWDTLELVCMKQVILDMPKCLDQELTHRRDTFTPSQTQLLCLARAVVRRSRVLVIDDIWSDLDPDALAVFSKVMRLTFEQQTVICIASRDLSVLDFESVVFVETGRVKEQRSADVECRDHDLKDASLMGNDKNVANGDHNPEWPAR